jgi:hypothetical protein
MAPTKFFSEVAALLRILLTAQKMPCTLLRKYRSGTMLESQILAAWQQRKMVPDGFVFPVRRIQWYLKLVSNGGHAICELEGEWLMGAAYCLLE